MFPRYPRGTAFGGVAVALDMVLEVDQGGYTVDPCPPFSRLGGAQGGAGSGVGHVGHVVAAAALGVHPPRPGVSNKVSRPVDGGHRDSVPCGGRALAVRGGDKVELLSGDVEEGVEEEVSDALPQGGRLDQNAPPGCVGWCPRCGGVAPPCLRGPRGAAVLVRGCGGCGARPVRLLVVQGVAGG